MAEHQCPHCGKQITKARSLPDHRRLFSVIRKAFENWPENSDFTPENEDHLRAYLTAKAGFRESTPVMLPEDATGHMRDLFRLGIEAAVRAAGGHAFVVPYRDGAAVIRAKSIAFSKLGQREFADVRSRIEDVILAETGMHADDLLRAAEAA